MFKNIAGNLANKAKNAIDSKVNNAAQKKADQVAQAGLKKVSLKVSGPLVDDLDQFKSEWEQKAKDPKESVFYFLMAAYQYAQGNKETGDAMASIILPTTSLEKDESSPTGFKLNANEIQSMEYFATNPDVINSFLGGDSKNNFQVNPQKLVMSVVGENKVSEDATVAVVGNIKGAITILKLRQNKKGQWKLFDFSAMLAGDF